MSTKTDDKPEESQTSSAASSSTTPSTTPAAPAASSSTNDSKSESKPESRKSAGGGAGSAGKGKKGGDLVIPEGGEGKDFTLSDRGGFITAFPVPELPVAEWPDDTKDKPNHPRPGSVCWHDYGGKGKSFYPVLIMGLQAMKMNPELKPGPAGCDILVYYFKTKLYGWARRPKIHSWFDPRAEKWLKVKAMAEDIKIARDFLIEGKLPEDARLYLPSPEEEEESEEEEEVTPAAATKKGGKGKPTTPKSAKGKAAASTPKSAVKETSKATSGTSQKDPKLKLKLPTPKAKKAATKNKLAAQLRTGKPHPNREADLDNDPTSTEEPTSSSSSSAAEARAERAERKRRRSEDPASAAAVVTSARKKARAGPEPSPGPKKTAMPPPPAPAAAAAAAAPASDDLKNMMISIPMRSGSKSSQVAAPAAPAAEPEPTPMEGVAEDPADQAKGKGKAAAPPADVPTHDNVEEDEEDDVEGTKVPGLRYASAVAAGKGPVIVNAVPPIPTHPDKIIELKETLVAAAEESKWPLALHILSQLDEAPFTVATLVESGVGRTLVDLSDCPFADVAANSRRILSAWRKLTQPAVKLGDILIARTMKNKTP